MKQFDTAALGNWEVGGVVGVQSSARRKHPFFFFFFFPANILVALFKDASENKCRKQTENSLCDLQTKSISVTTVFSQIHFYFFTENDDVHRKVHRDRSTHFTAL